jgi:hypothetical protein
LVSKGKTHGAGFLEHIKGEISGAGAGNRNLPDRWIKSKLFRAQRPSTSFSSLPRPHGIELNLRKSARRAIIFDVPALALAAHFG